jgi:toxin ParE1/3/4
LELNQKYEISDAAVFDLKAIYRYTRENFGRLKARSYLEEFDVLFAHLGEYHEIGRSRNEVRKGLRSIAMRNHVVFYRSASKRVQIIRVLHASRDLEQFFPTEP